jgi:aryl-alcohol dehydrogenase-like predicted oxidoreductase
MDYTELGRTGLRVSVAGLGCGGPSRLGQATGSSEAGSVAVARAAVDAGITMFDTAEAYGTEEIVGKALEGRRDDVVIATKVVWLRKGSVISAGDLEHALDASLRRLRTDHVDVYFLHGVTPEHYEEVTEKLVPVLERLREAGKIGSMGVTEYFGGDTRHRMLDRALQDDWIDVVMLGFSLLNQSARRSVLQATRAKNVGTLNMFAVRRALSRPEQLRETVADLAEKGLLDADLAPDDPLGFLVHEGGAESVVDAAYRFCRHEPGIDVVLTGTGNVDHLRQNVTSLLRPPLPEPDAAKLRELFARVDVVSGN